MHKLYDKVEKYIEESFGSESTGYKHLIRTAHWIGELNPNASDELLIAAVSHDIERAFRSEEIYESLKEKDSGYMDKEFLEHHQCHGAEIMKKFLLDEGADKKFVEKVYRLIEKHEFGGDEEQNILKDADSVSFFENNIDHFLDKKIKESSTEKVKKKINWMYERITSEKAREIVQPWYDDAMKRLKNV